MNQLSDAAFKILMNPNKSLSTNTHYMGVEDIELEKHGYIKEIDDGALKWVYTPKGLDAIQDAMSDLLKTHISVAESLSDKVRVIYSISELIEMVVDDIDTTIGAHIGSYVNTLATYKGVINDLSPHRQRMYYIRDKDTLDKIYYVVDPMLILLSAGRTYFNMVPDTDLLMYEINNLSPFASLFSPDHRYAGVSNGMAIDFIPNFTMIKYCYQYISHIPEGARIG